MKEEIISKKLLDILACPICKKNLQLLENEPKNYGLKCIECKKIYPIRENIPIMLIDEAIDC